MTLLLLVFISLIAYSWFVHFHLETDTVVYAAESSHELTHKAQHLEDGEYDVSEINELIRHYASKYDVSAEVMRKVINCESSYDPDIQSQKTYENGEQELSFGIAQIHLPSHPQVSKAEAQDPDYAVRFMAQHFQTGNHHLWTCFRKLYEEA